MVVVAGSLRHRVSGSAAPALSVCEGMAAPRLGARFAGQPALVERVLFPHRTAGWATGSSLVRHTDLTVTTVDWKRIAALVWERLAARLAEYPVEEILLLSDDRWASRLADLARFVPPGGLHTETRAVHRWHDVAHRLDLWGWTAHPPPVPPQARASAPDLGRRPTGRGVRVEVPGEQGLPVTLTAPSPWQDRVFGALAGAARAMVPPAAMTWTKTPGHGPGAEILGEIRGRRVVDLGCGAGHDAAHVALLGADVVGVDSAPVQVQRARAHYGGRANVWYTAAHAVRFLQTTPLTFAAIYSNHGAVGLAHPVLLLAAARKRLLPGGVLVFSVPHPDRHAKGRGSRDLAPRQVPVRLPDGRAIPVLRWDLAPDIWADLLEAAGFVDIRLRHHGPAPTTDTTTAPANVRGRGLPQRGADLGLLRDEAPGLLPQTLLITARTPGVLPPVPACKPAPKRRTHK